MANTQNIRLENHLVPCILTSTPSHISKQWIEVFEPLNALKQSVHTFCGFVREKFE